MMGYSDRFTLLALRERWEYARYRLTQIRQTRAKRHKDASFRIRPFATLVRERCPHLGHASHVLSLGPRNDIEIQILESLGLGRVTGPVPRQAVYVAYALSQVDVSTARKYGGTGQGLAISRRLTELMGGTMSVESRVGHGSEFRFTVSAPSAEGVVPPRRQLRGTQPTLIGKRVLVVDDNETNRRILGAYLDRWGMAVRMTGSPREALAWVEAGEPVDAGILDMHMPELDGVGLARAIRERRSAETLPLLLFTSLGRREAGAEEVGFAAHLPKPIKPSQLFDALAAALAGQPARVDRRTPSGLELDPTMARCTWGAMMNPSVSRAPVPR